MLNIGKDIDLSAVVRAAYELSVPQGLGFLHFQPGNLTDEQVASIVNRKSYGDIVLYMDYVLGRAVKLTVFRDESGMHYVPDRWYDHGSFDELFQALGITPEPRPEPVQEAL